MAENLRKIILQQSGYKNLQITKPSGKQQNVFYKKTWKVRKISLIENGKNISNGTELWNIFNVFF